MRTPARACLHAALVAVRAMSWFDAVQQYWVALALFVFTSPLARLRCGTRCWVGCPPSVQQQQLCAVSPWAGKVKAFLLRGAGAPSRWSCLLGTKDVSCCLARAAVVVLCCCVGVCRSEGSGRHHSTVTTEPVPDFPSQTRNASYKGIDTVLDFYWLNCTSFFYWSFCLKNERPCSFLLWCSIDEVQRVPGHYCELPPKVKLIT